MEPNATEDRILWRRMDAPGHEFASVGAYRSGHILQGKAVFAHEGEPCCLTYVVVCNSRWETSWGTVIGWVGSKGISVDARVRKRRWLLNKRECAGLEGVADLDLNFSPSTNLLPIRRLSLEIGQEARVRAAWLRFPSFDLVPLDQTYRRLGPLTYRYESENGFVREIEVRPSGLVTRYPDFWQEESP